jgi:hypothetical protein
MEQGHRPCIQPPTTRLGPPYFPPPPPITVVQLYPPALGSLFIAFYNL